MSDVNLYHLLMFSESTYTDVFLPPSPSPTSLLSLPPPPPPPLPPSCPEPVVSHKALPMPSPMSQRHTRFSMARFLKKFPVQSCHKAVLLKQKCPCPRSCGIDTNSFHFLLQLVPSLPGAGLRQMYETHLTSDITPPLRSLGSCDWAKIEGLGSCFHSTGNLQEAPESLAGSQTNLPKMPRHARTAL